MVRIVSDRPIEILKSAAREHLAGIWAHPQRLGLLFNTQAPPTPVEQWFTDMQMTRPVDKDSFQKRLIVTSNDPSQAPVSLVGLIPLGLPDCVPLITESMDAILAVPTDAADMPDGTLQLFGAEPGVLLLTMEQMRQQAGRKLYRGTPMHNFRLEVKEASGNWVPANVGISIPLDGVRSITPE